ITVPLIGSTLTPIVVFLPLVSITGVTGTFFRALAVTMSAALLTSLVLALSWTPTLSQFFIHGKQAGESTPEPLDIDQEMRRLMVAEEKSLTGFFGRVIVFYERWLRRALEHPRWLALGCAGLVLVAGLAYFFLGSDLLPEMDEGGFVVDYLTPAGTSLQETDRIVSHIEKILQAMPEVESTSRRTGLQLGLAAVTEANTGDISVKLKSKRSRGIEDIIADVRSEIAKQEPAADIEITQVLQDMIGDLTSAPEPVVIKMFSQDPKVLSDWAPRVADAISKISGVVDLKNGIENTISGPATTFSVNPTVAAKAGFTAEEVSTDATAILEGVPAPEPLVANQRAYTIRVRFPDQNRSSIIAMSNTLLTSSTGKTATLGALATMIEDPGQTEILRENLQRDVEVTARFEGVS